ncbi:MAG: UbiA family prenyltransferase [Dehalococcoidales bacterium]|nr:UbiA family prenyltransferase [Dehalococcoidales bacterium]
MFKNYFEILKPRESSLLTFIGFCAAIIAGNGQIPLILLLVILAVLLASAGANGLTNYLDREIDASIQRTRHRALPSKRIYPPMKVLPLVISITIAGLVLAWLLHPLCFLFDITGTIAAVVWRKRWSCVFPQGMIASCAPVLMGWLAIEPVFSWELLLLCVLIAFWLPLHVWSIMIANREDYLNSGLNYFPMCWDTHNSVKVLLAFSLVLYGTSIGLYFTGDFAWLYLVLANLLGIMMVYATLRLVISSTSRNAWRLYKLSAFPYLGLLFLTMCVDIWLT